jgi:hypothetical protein
VDATGYSADESIELDVKPGPDDVMEAADDPIEIEEIDIDDIEDIDDAHDVDDAPIPIEAVEDDAPVDDDEPEMELRLHTTSEDAEAEETGDVDEVPALEFTPFEPIHDESPSQPTEAPLTQEGLSEKNPKLELISELVEEVAEKAEELKEAWTELRFDEDDDSAQ